MIGSNGSGKSTFARTLNGLVTPTTGEVRVHGIDPVRQSRQLRRRVGFVFSNPDTQIIMPTVAEDAAFSLRGRGLSRAEVRERVAAALDRIGLSEYADSPAHTLSGGQKQLLALCAVLIGEPSLVVADEPTAYLDAANSRRIAGFLLDQMPQQLVLVTHDLRSGRPVRRRAAVRRRPPGRPGRPGTGHRPVRARPGPGMISLLPARRQRAAPAAGRPEAARRDGARAGRLAGTGEPLVAGRHDARGRRRLPAGRARCGRGRPAGRGGCVGSCW